MLRHALQKKSSGFTPPLKFRWFDLAHHPELVEGQPQSVPSGIGKHAVLESNVFPPASRGRHKNQPASLSRKRGESKFSAGFTLIEVLISLSIISLIGIAVATFQKDVFSVNSILSDSLTAEQQTRRAFKLMTAELRSASPSSSGAYPIASVSSTELIFYDDIDNDTLKERVRYILQGTVLKKGVVKPVGNPAVYNLGSETLSDIVQDVTNDATTPVFQYFDTSYDGASAPLSAPVNTLAIRLIKITIVVDKNSFRAPPAITVTTQVTLRNIKDNL